MLALSAIIHLLAFGALTGALTNPDGRLALVLLALPVLVLHLGVWGAARSFTLIPALVAAFILNAAWIGAGWLYWASFPIGAPIDGALNTTIMFFAPGLATSVFLICWMRLVSPRLRGDEFRAS